MKGHLSVGTSKLSLTNCYFEGFEKEKVSVQQKYGLVLQKIHTCLLSGKTSHSVTIFLISFVDLCTYNNLRKGQRQGIKVIMRSTAVKSNLQFSPCHCSAAEW